MLCALCVEMTELQTFIAKWHRNDHKYLKLYHVQELTDQKQYEYNVSENNYILVSVKCMSEPLLLKLFPPGGLLM